MSNIPSWRPRSLLGAALAAALLSGAASAAPTIANGSFESGLANWSIVNQLGSDGTFQGQTGVTSPASGNPVPAPTDGQRAAMSDATGPGSHVLYQDFVASVATGELRFDLFIGNRADRFVTPSTLAFDLTSQTGAQTLNQQARVDILLASADPFSVAPADILLNLYATQVGDALVSGYTTVSTDISALLATYAGQTLRLRFAETDNVDAFQMGVDNVRFAPAAAPEPGSWLLVAAALGGLVLTGRRRRSLPAGRAPAACALVGALAAVPAAQADTTPLTLLDPLLQVTPVASGFSQPIGIVFIGGNDYFVLEKASGRVKRVTGGAVDPIPVLDLAVNSNSERGLLSMALHPNFPANPSVYIYWTESLTGADSTVVSEVPLLGNRVDRFVWDGKTLTQAENIIKLRSRQTDNIAVPNHPGTNNANEAGNHNGGVIRFGPDGKLHIFIGDQGRRGWLQNLANGPFLTAPQQDDTFGGPAPDNAHLTGVVLRLNPDGTTPSDNPFFAAGAAIGGEVGTNIQKVFSYGHRNGFGMAFDPSTGALWLTENADDAYSEINRVVPGMNGGWIQLAGPAARQPDWKRIETTQFGQATQQVRYPPTRAAYNGAAALSRLFMLPGATYKDPDFSWRYEVGPSGTAFVSGTALGAAYAGTMWVGSARSFQQVGGTGGSLYRFRFNPDRLSIDTSADPRLADRVADNLFRAQKFEGTESESILIGRGFGITPSIEQGPDGNLYVVSLSDGIIYRISAAP